MTIRRFLDASSGHLSPETWTWLDEQTCDEAVRDPRHAGAGILGGRTRHGWFLYAGDAPPASIPADLVVLLRHARNRGCEYIALDCDALPLEDLPILHPDFQDERPPSPEPLMPIAHAVAAQPDNFPGEQEAGRGAP